MNLIILLIGLTSIAVNGAPKSLVQIILNINEDRANLIDNNEVLNYEKEENIDADNDAIDNTHNSFDNNTDTLTPEQIVGLMPVLAAAAAHNVNSNDDQVAPVIVSTDQNDYVPVLIGNYNPIDQILPVIVNEVAEANNKPEIAIENSVKEDLVSQNDNNNEENNNSSNSSAENVDEDSLVEDIVNDDEAGNEDHKVNEVLTQNSFSEEENSSSTELLSANDNDTENSKENEDDKSAIVIENEDEELQTSSSNSDENSIETDVPNENDNENENTVDSSDNTDAITEITDENIENHDGDTIASESTETDKEISKTEETNHSEEKIAQINQESNKTSELEHKDIIEIVSGAILNPIDAISVVIANEIVNSEVNENEGIPSIQQNVEIPTGAINMQEPVVLPWYHFW